jgi:hypothetical protein
VAPPRGVPLGEQIEAVERLWRFYVAFGARLGRIGVIVEPRREDARVADAAVVAAITTLRTLAGVGAGS